MSRPVLASETAALGLADEAYGQMVTLDDPGGAVALEPELARMYDALQGQTIPAMATDVAHGIRSLRNGAFEVLGDVMEGMADDRAVDVLRLAEANVRARLVQQAQETINQRNRGAGLAWTRYLGNRIGGAVRNVVGLVNEGATGRVFWGDGSYENRRVETEVQAQIAARFSGRTYDTLDPADQEMVRQEVGRLAPNVMAFQPRELLEWAQTTNVTLTPPPPPPTPPNISVYAMLERLMGDENVGSRYSIPILSLAQKNPAYIARLQEVYNDRVATPEVQRDYETEVQNRRVQDQNATNIAERIQRLEAALELLSQIREKETERFEFQTKEASLSSIATRTTQQEKNLQEFSVQASRASSALSGLVTKLKSKYRDELVTALTPPGGTPPDFADILALVSPPTPGTPPPSPPVGALRDPDQLNTLINNFQETLDGRNARAGVVAIVGLRTQLAQLKEDIARRDEPYPPANPLSQRYKDFAELKTQSDSSKSDRLASKNLTSHQLLYELLYRQTRVEIPPTGVVPPAGTRNLPLEEAQLRATIATLMLMDRVDSSMDEGFAVRQASNLARNRVIRFAERNARITFNEFVEDNLARQEAFKELGGLTLETTANDILNLLNTEKIKIENLPELMRQIELLGQDQLAGEGNLEFGVDVRPLLYQIQLAWYRRKAEALVDKVNEPGVDNKAETLLNLLKAEAPKAIPPQVTPGSQPLSVETRKESRLRRALDALRGKLEGVEPESDQAKVVNRQMSILQTLGTEFGTELVAELLANAMVKIPKWFAKKGALAAEATAEVAGEAVEQAAENSEALERLRQRTAARATQAVRRAA